MKKETVYCLSLWHIYWVGQKFHSDFSVTWKKWVNFLANVIFNQKNKCFHKLWKMSLGEEEELKKIFKSLLNVLQYYFCCLCSVYWPWSRWDPWPGVEPTPSALEGNLNPWTTREVQRNIFKMIFKNSFYSQEADV